MEFPLKSSRLQTVFKVFGKILDSIREPLIFLDPRLQVVKANRSFYETFHVKPEETEGMLIFDLGNRQWDIPKLRELLEEILPQNSVFDDLEVEHTFETIGRKVMHLNARRIYQKTGQPELILLAIEDVTEREDQKSHLEELVDNRTAELIVAKEEAEKALTEIKKLKTQLEAETNYFQEPQPREGFESRGLPGQILQDWSETATLEVKIERLQSESRFFKASVKRSYLSPT